MIILVKDVVVRHPGALGTLTRGKGGASLRIAFGVLKYTNDRLCSLKAHESPVLPIVIHGKKYCISDYRSLTGSNRAVVVVQN